MTLAALTTATRAAVKPRTKMYIGLFMYLILARLNFHIWFSSTSTAVLRALIRVRNRPPKKAVRTRARKSVSCLRGDQTNLASRVQVLHIIRNLSLPFIIIIIHHPKFTLGDKKAVRTRARKSGCHVCVGTKQISTRVQALHIVRNLSLHLTSSSLFNHHYLSSEIHL